MFRDSRGVVHTVSSADPLADLPAGAARALQEAVLAPPGPQDEVDLGSALTTADALRTLLERWQDDFFAALPEEVDLVEEARWAAEAGLVLSELEAASEDDDVEGLDDDLDDLDVDDLGDDDLDDLTDLDDVAVPGGVDDDLEVLLRAPTTDPDDPVALLDARLVSVLERELLLLPVRVRLEALVAADDLVQEWSELLADHEKLLGHLVLAHGQLPHPQALGHEELVDRHARLHDAAGPGHEGPR